jgi:hypothetical protein
MGDFDITQPSVFCFDFESNLPDLNLNTRGSESTFQFVELSNKNFL